MSDRRVSFADLEPMREAVRSYRAYRKAHGLPPSSWFEEKVAAGLLEAGFSRTFSRRHVGVTPPARPEQGAA